MEPDSGSAAQLDAAAADAAADAAAVDAVDAPVIAQLSSQLSPPSGGDSLLTFINPGGLPIAIAILLSAVVLSALVQRALAQLSERLVQRRLLVKQTSTLTGFAIYLLAAIAASSALFNFSSQAILALSGSLAVMVGFALKDFAASVLASLTILATRPFQVGDRITFGAYYGEVKEIGLRSIRLVTLDDNLVTIPSNKLLTESVASANAGALDCMVVIPFYITLKSDIARAREIVQDAVLASRYLYLGKPFTVLTSQVVIDGNGILVKLTAKAYVYDARHEKAFESDVTELVLQKFQVEKIGLPNAVPVPV